MTSTTGFEGIAWGGNAKRKSQAIAAVEAVPEGQYPSSERYLESAPGQPRPNPDGIYCTAFGAEPNALEGQCGVPLPVLHLACSVLGSCEVEESATDGDGNRSWYVAPAAHRGAARVLEAIVPGADLRRLPGQFLLFLLRDLESGGRDGSIPMSDDTRELVSRLLQLQEAGGGDVAGFKAVRKAAMRAADALAKPPQGDPQLQPMEHWLLEFVADVSWPVAIVARTLSQQVARLHMGSLMSIADRFTSPDDREVRLASMAAFNALANRREADPTLTPEWFHEQVRAMPEYQEQQAPEFQARRRRNWRLAADEMAPRSIDRLLRSLSSL